MIFEKLVLSDWVNVETHPHLSTVKEAYHYGDYLLLYAKTEGWSHLRIKLLSGDRCEPSFGELQEIKDGMLGKNAVAIQVYPKREDVIDRSHTVHLFSRSDLIPALPNLRKLYQYD